jgi:hypothetical protein
MTTVNAIGLVHAQGGVRALDRWWCRAIVARQARDHRLRLVDVLELGDDRAGDGQHARLLATMAARSGAVALVTHGVRPDVARALAEGLGLRHLLAPDRPGVPTA